MVGFCVVVDFVGSVVVGEGKKGAGLKKHAVIRCHARVSNAVTKALKLIQPCEA